MKVIPRPDQQRPRLGRGARRQKRGQPGCHDPAHRLSPAAHAGAARPAGPPGQEPGAAARFPGLTVASSPPASFRSVPRRSTVRRRDGPDPWPCLEFSCPRGAFAPDRPKETGPARRPIHRVRDLHLAGYRAMTRAMEQHKRHKSPASWQHGAGNPGQDRASWPLARARSLGLQTEGGVAGPAPGRRNGPRPGARGEPTVALPLPSGSAVGSPRAASSTPRHGRS